MTAVHLISETTDTVTVSRHDWEAMLNQLEDQQDRAAIAYSERALDNRVTYTAEETRRMVMEDVSPVTIWRERRGLTQAALANAAKVSKPYLSEIENGRKPGSVDALSKLSKALGVLVDDLLI